MHPKVRHPNYFEAVLQLREPSEEVFRFVRNQISKRTDVQVTNAHKLKNGWDFHITSQHFAQNLGKKLKQNFPGVLKISQKLHTFDALTSKKLYRVTVFFKLCDLKKGDKVSYKGEDYEVLGISKKAIAKNIKTGEKKQFEIEELCG